MRKQNIIINTICICTAIACIALTFWGNCKNNGVLTTDAFIGTCTTLIGICATIIVGVQIASYLELHETKRQIGLVKEERDLIQKEQEKIQDRIKFLGDNLSNAFVVIASTTDNNAIKSLAYLTATYCNDIKVGNSDVTINRYKSLRESIKVLSKEDKKALSTQVHKLKNINIPGDIEHYTEIMKLHFEIIEILENETKE